MCEEFPGALEGEASGVEPIDDENAAVRRALIEDANALAETLDRLCRGEDGI